MITNVFIHADAIGARLGNGGFLMLNMLALELDKMGYETALFAPDDKLNGKSFKWLSLPYTPKICPFNQVLQSKAPVITGWISGLMDVIGKIGLDRIRLWSADFLRDGMAEERKVVFQMPKIATPNANLDVFMRRVGYQGDIIILENWIRNDLFFPLYPLRSNGNVAYQSDNFVFDVSEQLRNAFGDRLVLCEGSQKEVAEKIRKCQFGISWNRHYGCFKEVGLRGETFNLSAFEMMASRVMTFMRRNDVWEGTRGLLMYDDLEEVIYGIQNTNYRQAKRISEEQVKLVRRRFTFDVQHRVAVRELLC